MIAPGSPVLAAALTVAAIGLATVPRRPAPTRSPTPATRPHRRARISPTVVLVLALGPAVVVLAPPLAPLVATAGLVGPRLGRHRRASRVRRERDRAVADCLPDVVDLLALCTSAGMSLPVAHPLIATRVPGPVGAALASATAAAAAGQPRADALVDALSPLGEGARHLGQVLADHLRYGVALAPSLDRLGSELRLQRRRRAEIDARRVPVRLLGPLVACVLPAFALLTVVPLLAATLRSLPR